MWGVSENVPVVHGAECLPYLNKPIGFLNGDDGSLSFYSNIDRRSEFRNPYWVPYTYDDPPQFQGMTGRGIGTTDVNSLLMKWYHNSQYRKIGLIRGSSDDGGIHISILGSEMIHNNSNNRYIEDAQIGDMFIMLNQVGCRFDIAYKLNVLDNNYWLDRDEFRPSTTISYGDSGQYYDMYGAFYTSYDRTRHMIDFDQAQNFDPNNLKDDQGQPLHGGSAFFSNFGIGNTTFGSFWKYNGNMTQSDDSDYYLTDNPETSLEFGILYDTRAGYGQWIRPVVCPKVLIDYPTSLLKGNMYDFMCNEIAYNGLSSLPEFMEYGSELSMYVPFSNCYEVTKVNLGSIPFNLLLTTDYGAAKRYLLDGTLPFDAKLYPLDWENLPSHDFPLPDPDDPEPDDTPDDTIVDPTPDDVVDVDPDVDPTTTVQNLCNYNLYWLQADQWSGFINWFWHDISAWSGFDDLINSIQGLYNDLGSAVIMCRYMPVKVGWIGGLGDDENIKLGMIEKTGNVNTISKRAVPIRRDLGEITINQIVSNNFLDFSPYSQLSLYLPLHGFVDLDMNIFQGHKNDYKKLIIQGIYDLLSGTLQYLIYVKPNGKDKALVNSFVVKIAQDIPLTLQTKNDRDSMIFGNVASTVGGLLGAGASIATGNPIGIAMGSMNAVNTLASAGSKSAPMSVKGTTGEMGGLYAPERPMIILRRAAVQPSDSYEDADKRLDTWKSRVGRLSGYGQPMSSINGYVQLAQPRIKFTHNIPLQSEIDELYQILQQGFVCSTKS